MFKRVLLLCLLLQFFNCEEIIEVDDISEEIIVILAPSDNTTIEASSINFSWQELEFGETYHLQIATPNFDAPQQIVEDTLITSNNFSITLPANNYQWQVKAMNSAYETQFTTQSLTVEE
tara:strand:- start:255 stop:614 length:360 start_codon:yes stop_codon:yes gene_type:complete